MGTFQTFGKLANKKGEENEDRVLETFKNAKVPDWFHNISKTIDSFPNIDFIIKTDVGPIYLQIKSSKEGKLKFKNKLGTKSKYIACVVVKRNDDGELIRTKVVSSVGELRKIFLKERFRDENISNSNYSFR